MKVKIISQQGENALIEWYDGRYHRSWIPLEYVVQDGDETTCEIDPNEGIPYGLPWEEIIIIEVTPEMVANELRRRGIYTFADFTTYHEQAASAIATCYGLNVGSISARANQFISEELNNGK